MKKKSEAISGHTRFLFSLSSAHARGQRFSFGLHAEGQKMPPRVRRCANKRCRENVDPHPATNASLVDVPQSTPSSPVLFHEQSPQPISQTGAEEASPIFIQLSFQQQQEETSSTLPRHEVTRRALIVCERVGIQMIRELDSIQRDPNRANVNINGRISKVIQLLSVTGMIAQDALRQPVE